jgi:peptidoglycan/xylan/chitin deacetylase (PgdA/CDA1 family)
VTQNEFEKQLKYISRKFEVISLKEYFEIRNSKERIKYRLLVITFDDGYLDNWIWAFPLLKKYKIQATIFVSPEFVDHNSQLRPNLDDFETGKVSLDELNQWGHLSWDEMRFMENSGYIDIQSHTMTHTKYFISDTLVGFHNPSADAIYPICNLYPEYKPFYIQNKQFNSLMPYGYPFFEEASSVLARRVFINPEFIDYCIDRFHKYNFDDYSFRSAFTLVESTYRKFKERNNIIINSESEEEYLSRINYEIAESKRIIESELNKEVHFLCWPHGDNTEMTHKIALDAGYKMTTAGAYRVDINDPTRVPSRLGMDISSFPKRLKFNIKIKATREQFPYRQIVQSVRSIKHFLR